MERLRAAVCEDDRGERERLVQMVSESAPDVTVEAFGSAEELLDAYYPGKFDVILLDIYMEGMTGIRALEKIRRIDTEVVAAIATTSQDFALESYRLRAARYLEKPVSGVEIADLLRYVIRKKESEPHYECGSADTRIRIPFDAIDYVEQRGKNLCIHLGGGQEVMVRGRLDEEGHRFPVRYFFRCHKSYLVNVSRIRAINRELMTFVMEDGENVHIRRQDFFAAKRVYEQYLYSIAESWKAQEKGSENEDQ